MKKKKIRVGIVGGGAAGMMAAITAARQGALVTLFERNDRVGKKILVTGNGKCNLGNEKLSEAEYFGGNQDFIEKCLKKFGTEDTIQFFQGIGLLVKQKNGYLYPVCEQAAAVLDVLRIALRNLGVEVKTQCKINDIKKHRDTEQILLSDGETVFSFDCVIIAAGGKAAPKTGSDGSGFKLAKKLGHTIIPTVPSLVQLRCREDYLKAVSGVRADAEIKVMQNEKCIAKERGELQLTDYGVSGIVVFQISRIVNYIIRQTDEVEICINFLPDYCEEDYKLLCQSREVLQKRRTVEEFFTGILHKKLMMLFLKMAGLKPDMPAEQAGKEKMTTVYELCREWKLHVCGSNPYDNAQVCAGGVSIDEITENMESKKVSGVYFAGEIMDVDGKCGGYNLQWAWCSGYLAGMAACETKESF